MYLHGKLKRLKELNVKDLWFKMKQDLEFMRYFPDSCHRKVPSKTYFWKVYYYLKRYEFMANIDEQIKVLRKKNRIKNDKLVLSVEAQSIFKDFNVGDNLRLLGNMISKKRC